VVEAKNVQATAYVLSWTGTAQARYAVNSATPAGAYAASPILITGQTVGTVMSVEFGNGASAGTLGAVQLEPGAIVTPFEQRLYGHELMLCQRYCYVPSNSAFPTLAIKAGATVIDGYFSFPVEMYAAPTLATVAGTTWATSAPSGNQIGWYNNIAAAYATISGALALSIINATTKGGAFRAAAATSFSGTNGDNGNFFTGTGVGIVFSAEL